MSRHVLINDDGSETAYGLDHACGYFIMKLETNDEGREVATLNLDYLNSNKGEIVEKMVELGVPEDKIERVVLDLPI